jgi:UPF0716 protein FxsA
MVKWFIIAVLFLPVAEIAVFVLVAAQIGVSWALALMLATTLAGAVALRHAGRGELARLRMTVADTGQAGRESWIGKLIEANAGGFLTVLAGLLLLLPGFLTDLLGLALLFRPIQRRLIKLIARRLHHRDPEADGVVDLAQGEWQRVPDPRIKDATRHRE